MCNIPPPYGQAAVLNVGHWTLRCTWITVGAYEDESPAAEHMFSFLVSIRRHLRLRAYAWAEMIPHVRQRLNLHLDSRCSLSSSTCGNGPTAESTLCITTSTTVVLDEGVTSRLQHRCMRRGTPVDSVLLASLFLAATEFARLDKSDAIAPEKTDQDVSDTRQHQPGRDDPRPSSLGIRLQKALVLGVVCIVMTLLSGSVESKALRYFCSIYAVVAGEHVRTCCPQTK